MSLIWCQVSVSQNHGKNCVFFWSIRNFEVTIVSGRVWYCVEFDVTFYAGDSWKHYLWLHEGIETAGVGENRAYISTSSDYSCDTNNPTNVWSSSNPLRGMLLSIYSTLHALMLIYLFGICAAIADGAHCPAIPDDAM